MAETNVQFIYNIGATSIDGYKNDFGKAPIILWVVNKIWRAWNAEIPMRVFSENEIREVAAMFGMHHFEIGNTEDWRLTLTNALLPIPIDEPPPIAGKKNNTLLYVAGAALLLILLTKRG